MDKDHDIHKILLERIGWMLEADDFETAKLAMVSFNKEHDIGKQYLVDHLYNHVRSANKIIVGGGWTGVLANKLQLRYKCHVLNLDSDQRWIDLGCKIFPNVQFKCQNNWEHESECDIWASTSCEHYDREELVFEMQKRKGTVFALQSNNWYGWPTHINCSDSLADFIEYLPLNNIYYSGEHPIYREKYKRFTVIGS